MSILLRLRPTEREVYELASRETDPRFHSQFTPITRGFLFAVLAILVLGLLAVLYTPFRLLRPRR
jgi:hypothetical protein